MTEVTPSWLSDALAEAGHLGAPIASLTIEPQPDNKGLIGDLAIVHLEYEGSSMRGPDCPVRLALKLPAQNPDSRRIGSMLNAYQREAAFYEHVAPHVEQVPRCFFNGSDRQRDRYVLAIEYIDGDPCDPALGATEQQARAGVDALASLHGEWWGRATEFDWMPGFDRGGVGGLASLWRQNLPVFTQRYRDSLPGDTASWALGFVPRLAGWSDGAADEPLTLVHADFRLDNLLFRDDGVMIIDWQTAMRAPPAMDLSCFLTTSLTIDQRREHEGWLIERYLSGLASCGIEVDRDWFGRSYDEHLLWWMGQFGNNLAHLEPDNAALEQALTAMVERVYWAGHDHDVGRLL